MHHVSVLLLETVEALAVVPGGSYIDGTLGGAGHACEILKRAGPRGRLMAVDKDTTALAYSAVRLKDLPGEKVLVHGSHGDIGRLAEERGFSEVDGVLIDCGVSSEHLDNPDRGFSFRHDGPLDMRMDQTQGESAADLLARLDEQALADILHRLGEEPRARRVARAILRAQEKAPIVTTGRLAAVVSDALGGRTGARHAATRTFQALRMAVNREIEDLERALEAGLQLIRPGGRMAAITFESVCDGIVKHTFASHAGKMVSLQEGGERWEGMSPAVTRVTRRPVVPGEDELAMNPRARSAKLRVVQRMPGI